MKTSNRPKIPIEIEQAILLETGHRCAVCGESCPVERAHIIPWCKAQEHAVENLIVMCANCHGRADKEKWGEKVLKAYKERPWILRRSDPACVTSARKKIQITLVLDWNTFDENHERLIVLGLSKFLNLPPDAIIVRAKKRGSVKLIVSIPMVAAERLLSAFASNEAELFSFLNQHKILEIDDLGMDNEEPIAEQQAPREIKEVGQSLPLTKLPTESPSQACRKLYVGNVSFKTTEDELRSAFGQFGSVTDVYVAMDKMTGRPRGFAFVTMGTADEAKAAAEKLNGTDLRGRQLTVNEARPTEERPGGLGSSGFGGGRGGNRGRSPGGTRGQQGST